MEIKNPNKINPNIDKKESKETSIPSSDEFQKEIDKKIKEENKEKKTTNKEEKLENKTQENKSNIDTKDLTTLKLFVLPYINKDILSVNMKNFIHKEEVFNTKNTEQKEKNLYLSESKDNIITKPKQKDENTKQSTFEFNPFSTFEKLSNSLKELAKEEKVKESKIIREIIQKLDIQKLQDSRIVEIKFDKEKIGNISVHILNEGNKVSVVFKTNSKFLYDELKNNKELLKEMLESRNLKSEKIIIDYQEVI